MFPNLGTKGTGEPVVQPAERVKSVYPVGPCSPKPLSFGKGLSLFALPLGLLALSGCGTAPSGSLAYNAVPGNLPADGGTVSFFWKLGDGAEYTLTSDPPVEGLPLTTRDTVATLKLRGNADRSAKTYRFTLEATGPGGNFSRTQTVEVAAQANAQPQCAGPSSLRVASLAKPEGSDLRGIGSFEAPHVPGRLIVYRGSGARPQSQAPALSRLGVQRLRGLDGGWEVYKTPQSDEAAAKALVDSGLAQYVQPEYLYEEMGLSTPPSNRDYGLDQDEVFRQMNWEGAWKRLSAGCAAPTVAVIDTGFFTSRSDLRPNLAPEAGWLDVVGADIAAPAPVQGQVAPAGGVSRGHGTSVAGIIAGTTNDGSALAGAAYNLVKVLPIKVFDAARKTGTLQVAQAIEYAAGSTTIAGQTFVNPSPAQVINLSLATRKVGFTDPYVESVLKRVTEAGGVVVASSGNAGLGTVGYPASSPYVIAVGATDASGLRAQWGQGFGSNYGSDLEFVAPGTAVPTLEGENYDEYGNSYGTSVSAPFVSAAVALYMYQNRQVKGLFAPEGTSALDAVRRCLRSAAQHGWEPETGYGLVDVAKVVDPANRACY